MRKVVASSYMSLDGLIALPDGYSGWPTPGSERYHCESLLLLHYQRATTEPGSRTPHV